MRWTCAAVVTLLATHEVAADDAWSTFPVRDSQGRRQPVEVVPANTRSTWRIDALASAIGTGQDSARAEGSLGAEAAYSGEMCDFAVVGGLPRGLELSLDRDLGRHLTARAHAAAGKSVYATGATFAAPAWGAEATLTLGLHIGNR